MAKKNMKKTARKIYPLAAYGEALFPPTFEDVACPEPCEEVACLEPCEAVICETYDQDCPAPCYAEPYPESFEEEDDPEASKRWLTLAQERSTQPLNPDIIEEELKIKREPTLTLAETSREVSEQAWISPYTKAPVPIHLGAEGTAYLVPPHLLPSKWLESGVREQFEFPDIDTHTGHTIVHYLYTGSYETPPTSNLTTPHKHNGLGAALLVFVATSSHGLHDLQQLASREIEKHGSSLSLSELLETIDDKFSRLDQHSWVHEYLRRRAKDGFDQDHTVFSDEAFLQNLSSAALIKFMARCVVDLYSTKLARMLNTRQAVGQSESLADRDRQHASWMEDSAYIARVTSRISSARSEVSVEQASEPRVEAVTLSDSFSTLSCSIPDAPPLETDPCPEPIVEDDCRIPGQTADSAPPEISEAIRDSWPDSEQALETEPEMMPDSPCLVEEAADESVTRSQRRSTIPSEAQDEDMPEAVDVGEQAHLPPCHSQVQHVLLGTGWKSCAQCFNVVRRLAGQVSKPVTRSKNRNLLLVVLECVESPWPKPQIGLVMAPRLVDGDSAQTRQCEYNKTRKPRRESKARWGIGRR